MHDRISHCHYSYFNLARDITKHTMMLSGDFQIEWKHISAKPDEAVCAMRAQ
jgi:hypothetical protein